jgi:hypothetical protein
VRPRQDAELGHGCQAESRHDCATVASTGLSDGYRIIEMNELADGSGVVASLKLISGSSTYGPDLEDLKLTAR